MSKLNVDQKTIMLLFSDKKSDFLIPDYQRPYAWEETQCQTLIEMNPNKVEEPIPLHDKGSFVVIEALKNI